LKFIKMINIIEMISTFTFTFHLHNIQFNKYIFLMEYNIKKSGILIIKK
jgi:hypothetical protein